MSEERTSDKAVDTVQTKHDPLAEIPEDVHDEAETMLRDLKLTDRIIEDVSAMGVSGEHDLILAIYLIGTSRLLK